MILVDTSIWVDHLGRGDARLAQLLEYETVLMHPFVIGEIALGNLSQRAKLLEELHSLPKAAQASDREVLHLIESAYLGGVGIGLVDAHLLASARLMSESRLWTRDRRLHGCARAMSLAYYPEH